MLVLSMLTTGEQECMIGVAFSDESEASALNKKVLNRKKYAGEWPDTQLGMHVKLTSRPIVS
jgi:hypothetical protein